MERGRDTVHAGPVEAGAGVESRGEAAIVGTGHPPTIHPVRAQQPSSQQPPLQPGFGSPHIANFEYYLGNIEMRGLKVINGIPPKRNCQQLPTLLSGAFL